MMNGYLNNNLNNLNIFRHLNQVLKQEVTNLKSLTFHHQCLKPEIPAYQLFSYDIQMVAFFQNPLLLPWLLVTVACTLQNHLNHIVSMVEKNILLRASIADVLDHSFPTALELTMLNGIQG